MIRGSWLVVIYNLYTLSSPSSGAIPELGQCSGLGYTVHVPFRAEHSAVSYSPKDEKLASYIQTQTHWEGNNTIPNGTYTYIPTYIYLSWNKSNQRSETINNNNLKTLNNKREKMPEERHTQGDSLVGRTRRNGTNSIFLIGNHQQFFQVEILCVPKGNYGETDYSSLK